MGRLGSLEMPDGRSVLLPQMIDARLRDIIQDLSLPTGTAVQGPSVHRIQKVDGEANWDCTCSFNPDPDGQLAREFERKKYALQAVFKLPEQR
jgi:hypothetical protein